MDTSLNNRSIIKSWCLYDWANSVYNLTITTAIFPSYFQAVTQNTFTDNIPFLGFTVTQDSLFSFILSIAFGVIVILNLILAGVSDVFGNKKLFLKIFSTLGAVSCSLLYFFDKNHFWFGANMFMLATIGYAGSLVYYNSYLPLIASPRLQDKVSALGFSYGYVGSVIMLIINLIVILGKDLIGIDEGLACKISFLMVGIWWFVFATYSFSKLPDNKVENSQKIILKILSKGILDIKHTYSILSKEKRVFKFLVSFFFYSAGIQTVMYLATIFGKVELKLEQAQLIPIILIIQLIAIVGASFMSKATLKWGNLKVLLFCCFFWIAICVGAYFTVNFIQFCLLAVVVGFMMGGIQSLSRSTFSKMLPEQCKNASSFSFYEFIEKLSIVLGTFSFGIISMITGGLRQSIFALVIYFVISIILLVNTLYIKKKV